MGTVAARLTRDEKEHLAKSIERFARLVASRVYLIAENDGMKRAFRDRDQEPTE